MRIVDLSQNNDQWLAWRKEGITATDAVILSGRSPYKTKWRLWAEKVDYARPVDLSGNPLVRHGKENESLAREDAEEHFNDLILPACVESTYDPVIRASLDGLNSKNEPVELKCPSQKVWDEVCAQGTNSNAYQMHWVQVQYQMLCVGSDVGYLVFWFEGQIKCFEITADKAFLSDLYMQTRQFWSLVQTRTEPAKDIKEDLYIPKGEQADQWILEAQVFKSFGAQIQELQTQIEDLKQLQTVSLDALKELMGEYYHADYCGVMITRYHVEGRVDYKQLIADKAQGITAGDVDQYRGKPSERWRVTVSESNLPRHIVEPEVLAPLESADDFEVFYF